MGLILNTSTVIRNLSIGPLSGGGEGGGGGSSEPSSFTLADRLFHYDYGDPTSYGGSGNNITDLAGTIATTQIVGDSRTYVSSGDGSYMRNGGTYQLSNFTNSLGQYGQSPSNTYSAWYNFSGYSGTDTARNIAGTGSNNYRLYFDEVNNRFNVTVAIGNSLQSFYINNFSTLISAGSWFNIAIVFDSTSCIRYVNGVQQATTAHSGENWGNTNDGPVASYFNINNWYNYPYDISVAQAVYYTNALTATQVLGNFNALKSRYGY